MKHQFICERVKAHADQFVADVNDVCDALAKHEIQKIQNQNELSDLEIILEHFNKRHKIAIK